VKGGVRVTGGAFRGRALRVPPGARPTEGRVREALFSIWQPHLLGARVLDLYAGSGVVGLEAAGRGALRVVCVDEAVAAVRAVAGNAALVGEALVETRRLTLPAGLERLAAEGSRFDLIYADPPYSFAEFRALLEGVRPLLDRDGEVVLEHSSRRAPPLEAAGLVRTGTRRYGESALSFYRHGPDQPPVSPEPAGSLTE
jgi:16S rRNA (guanine966-N2)-methyltransferase